MAIPLPLGSLLGSAAGGPISVGVILTAATIGGLVLAFQHSERFRDAVNKAKDNVVKALPEFEKLKSAFNIDGEGGKSALGAGESTLVLFATLLERITASIGPMASAVSTAAPALSLLTGPLPRGVESRLRSPVARLRWRKQPRVRQCWSSRDRRRKVWARLSSRLMPPRHPFSHR